MVAQKYGVDTSRLKEYIQGGPDPEKGEANKKLVKASEQASIEEQRCSEIHEKFNQMAEKKRLI